MNTAAKLLLLVLSLSCSAAPPMMYDVDVKAPLIARPIPISEGTTPLLRFRLLNGNSLVVATNYTGTLYLSETWDSDEVITIPSTAVGTNHLDFQLTTGHTATNGTFRASLVVASGSETIEWARGVVELSPNPALSGADEIEISNPFAFAGLTFSGVSSDGPYKAGSGISFSAPDGRGRVAVNATGALPDVMLASEYDTDENGSVDSADAVVGINFADLATDAEVAGAVAAVHPALTLKAGSIGALAGQELEISPAMVASSLSGLTINPITMRAPDGEAMNIEAPAGEVIQLIPDGDSGSGSVNVNGAMNVTGAVSASGYTGDGSALSNLPTPVWAVEWGPGEIVGPFYDGANDAAGWSRKAEVNGTYPTGIAGMGMSSSLTTLQDVTIYVHRHTPRTSAALDTAAAFELTFWTTTASAADQKFDLVISGSNRSGGGQTTVYTKTGIVGAAGVVTTLVIPVGAVSYFETSAGTVTNQAESLSSSTLYRLYTFKIVMYSRSSNRVNFVGCVINGR